MRLTVAGLFKDTSKAQQWGTHHPSVLREPGDV